MAPEFSCAAFLLRASASFSSQGFPWKPLLTCCSWQFTVPAQVEGYCGALFFLGLSVIPKDSLELPTIASTQGAWTEGTMDQKLKYAWDPPT